MLNSIQCNTHPEPATLWSAELGQPPAGPSLVVGDLLLVPTQEPGPPSQHSTLHALSLADGSLLWQKSFEYALVSGLAAVQTSEFSETAEVWALVASSSTDLMRSKGALLALDAAGEQRWHWSADVQRVSAPAVAGDAACITADTKMLVAFDLTTGAERAKIELKASASRYAPALVDGIAYIPCRGPHLLAVGLDGGMRWRFDAEESPDAWLDKTPVVVGERLFAVLSTGAALALRMEDGSLAWRVDVGPTGKRLSAPVTDGERLYVGARDGLHALDLADGREMWAFPTNRRIEAAPAIVGGVVYVTCHDHHLYALEAATGQELWHYEVERRIEVPPVVATCGEPATPCVLVADRGGTLTAVARALSAEEHEVAEPGPDMAAGPGEPMAVPQRPASAERPAPPIPVSPTIRQLATLIHARRQASDWPYTLLLGSSLSLTAEVRQAVCGSDDWGAFWTAMQGLSAPERRALLASPLDSLNLGAGYRCLAELAQAGYFNILLTANIDAALDDALRTLPASECQVLCHGQTSAEEIAAALSRPRPRVKAIKLRGDINAYKLPLTPEGQFEFPKALEEAVKRLLSQDTILVGDIPYDTDIQRCIRQGEGALWVAVPEEPRPGSFLYNAKRVRPKGEVISGPEAEFVSFFLALARELGVDLSAVPLVGELASLFTRGDDALPVSHPQEPTEIRRRYALLIGVRDYVDATYRTLPHTVYDVSELARVLEEGGYTVRVLHSDQSDPVLKPTRENIWGELENLGGVTGPGDLLLVHFGGHGDLSGDKAYLLPANARKASLHRTAIDLAEFKQVLFNAGAQAKILILDACHSGIGRGATGMGAGFERHVHLEATGAATLAACRRGEVAYEHDTSPHGAFTYYLLEGLRSASAREGGRFVTFDDLKDYVTNAVKDWAIRNGLQQWPNASTQLVGDPPLIEL